MGKLEANQMVAVGVGHPEGSRTEIADRLGQRMGGSQRCTGNFEQNLLCERQRAANRDQGAAGGDVKRGGELQKLFSSFVAATNKYRYSDGETRPFAALCFRIQTLQTHPFKHKIALLPQLGGQTSRARVAIWHQKPASVRAIPGKSGTTAGFSRHKILLTFAPQDAFSLEL